MPTPQDQEFIRFAVAGGHMTQEQADQAVAALRDIEGLGGTASAPDLLLRKGLLTERQIGLIHQVIASSKTATKVPRELGSFELIEKVGQGGMGSVFKARQKELDRVVALKILSPRLARDKGFVERFLREARSAGRLSHPNIVGAIDVGESEGFFYFAMEYVDGETLGQRLAREGRLPEAQALAITTEVARALDHAHSKGLIHRDIKPDNIMLTKEGRVRVTDFGLAKALGGDDPGASDAERFLGTPAYVAPEQIRSEPSIDCRADIFSLGVTLFQMLTGELPFKGAHPMAVAASVMADPLPPLRKLAPEVSPVTGRILERMAAKRREDRYATPAELIAALESAAAAPRPAARPAARPGPPRRAPARPRSSPTALYVAAACALVALLGTLVAVVAFNKPKPPAETPLAPLTRPTTETPVVVVPPKPRTSTAVADKALVDRLAKAVADVLDFSKQNPSAYGQRVARCRDLVASYPTTVRIGLPAASLDLLGQVEAELKRTEGERQDAATAELTQRNELADSLFKNHKIGEGLRLFDTFPVDLRTDETSGKLERLRDQYRKVALSEYQVVDDKGRRLIQQSRIEDAKALYLDAKGWNIPEISEQTKEPLATIERLLAKLATVDSQAAMASYRQLVQVVLDRLDAREYAEPRKLVDAALVDPKLAPAREKLRGLQLLIRDATEVWARVAAGAKKLNPGDPIRVGGLQGQFVRYENEKIYWKTGEVTAARSIAELKSGEALALAFDGSAAPGAQFEPKIALFLLADRDYDTGRKRLEAAKAKGTDVTDETALFDRLAPRFCPTCQAKQAVPCATCEGKGYTAIERVECETCRGKGILLCGNCRGKGRLRCGNCVNGRTVLGMACQECGGRVFLNCTHCRGTGRVSCKQCDGDGFINRKTVCDACKGKKAVSCTTCAGKGVLPPADLSVVADTPPPEKTPAPVPKKAPKAPPDDPAEPAAKAPPKGARPEPIDMP